jgi:hypothetical protein
MNRTDDADCSRQSCAFGRSPEQLVNFHAEAMGEFLCKNDSGISQASLDARHVGPVDPRNEPEFFLRQSLLQSEAAHIRAKELPHVHTRDTPESMPIGPRTMSHNLLDFRASGSNLAAMPDERASYLDSSGLEKILEHRFVAELASVLWLEGCRDVEILRSEVDAHGYDLVIEARGTMRHIQLKSMVVGGKKQHVTVNTRLVTKPSGCVVWFDYDPKTLELGPFRWFGAPPGAGLPEVGDAMARHAKANSHGQKKERTGHRVVRKSRFQQVDSLADLNQLLFGDQQPTWA